MREDPATPAERGMNSKEKGTTAMKTHIELFDGLDALDETGRAALYASAAKDAARFLDADDVAGYVAIPADEAHLGGIGATEDEAACDYAAQLGYELIDGTWDLAGPNGPIKVAVKRATSRLMNELRKHGAPSSWSEEYGLLDMEPEEKRVLAEVVAEAGRRFVVEGEHEDHSPEKLVFFAQRDVDCDWRAAFSYSEDEDMTRIETGLAAVELLLDPAKAASVVLDCWDEEWDD
jgi:hypothetical protein